jgi:hexosaminidase
MVRRLALLYLCVIGVASVLAAPLQSPQASANGSPLHIIPQPLSVTADTGSFALGPKTVLGYHAKNADARKSVDYLANLLRQSTGFPFKVVDASTMPAKIRLSTSNAIRT